MKNTSYHDTHTLLTGNLLFVRSKTIDAYFKDTLDDIFDTLRQRPSIVLFLDELKHKVQMFTEIALKKSQELRNLVREGLKNTQDSEKNKHLWRIYASHVKSHFSMVVFPEKLFPSLPLQPPLICTLEGFLFSQKMIIMNGDESEISRSFLSWLKSNYHLFNEYWKKTNVEEILKWEKIQEKVVLGEGADIDCYGLGEEER
eukprot:TRINITY_DN835_c0_g1_i18.p1 TRINITY_DN835_c0_g1~~TRINITY_DN835_c0_g1_i18.p1  ORF type:complete len:201 (+),score=43.35 TRINITY_DN835_c0_g1_i18:615-1217(+)